MIVTIIMGGLLLLTVVRTDDDFCDDKSDGIHYDPKNCTRYYNCADGRTYLQSCPPDLRFDPIQEDCDWPKNVICVSASEPKAQKDHEQQNEDVQPKDTEFCDHKEDGLYPDPYDCTRFYKCLGKRTENSLCGEGSRFNPNDKICDKMSNVQCVQKNVTKHEQVDKTTQEAFLTTSTILPTQNIGQPITNQQRSKQPGVGFKSASMLGQALANSKQNVGEAQNTVQQSEKTTKILTQQDAIQHSNAEGGDKLDSTKHGADKQGVRQQGKDQQDNTPKRLDRQIVKEKGSIHHSGTQQGGDDIFSKQRGVAEQSSKQQGTVQQILRNQATAKKIDKQETSKQIAPHRMRVRQSTSQKGMDNKIANQRGVTEPSDQLQGNIQHIIRQQGMPRQGTTQQNIDYQTAKKQGTAHKGTKWKGTAESITKNKKEFLLKTHTVKPESSRSTSPGTIDSPGCKRRVCYFTNWARLRPGNGSQYPGDLMDGLCTHIMYAFATINETGMLGPTDDYDEPFDDDIGGYRHVIKLKERDPSLKVLLSVGGWNMGSWPFHKMARTNCTRDDFIVSTISFLRDQGFDGIDIDWEFPPKKENYVILLKELRRAFGKEAQKSGKPRLLMTAAVGAGKGTIDTAYDVTVMNSELDFISLMGYDFHGPWDATTGHNSPLYAGSWEKYAYAYLNLDWVAKYWVKKGVRKDKFVIGLPMYGHSFTLKNSSDTGIGANVTGAGRGGNYTGFGGFLSYYEVCSLMQQGAKKYFIEEQRVPYLVHEDQWVGYDDEDSVRAKVRYILDNGYGGVMIWSLGLDDFKGVFCGRGRYPLMTAINKECGKG